MADLDALVLLLDRYLSWGRIPHERSLADAVQAFEAERGAPAVREAREAIGWLQGRPADPHERPNPLTMDSLDIVEFMFDVEARYGVTVPDRDATSLPELLERVRRVLDDSDDEGGSAVGEPRPPRPAGPRSDNAIADIDLSSNEEEPR